MHNISDVQSITLLVMCDAIREHLELFPGGESVCEDRQVIQQPQHDPHVRYSC